MDELLKVNFRKVLMKKSMSESPQGERNKSGMWETEAKEKEIILMLGSLEVRKAVGSDVVE